MPSWEKGPGEPIPLRRFYDQIDVLRAENEQLSDMNDKLVDAGVNYEKELEVLRGENKRLQAGWDACRESQWQTRQKYAEQIVPSKVTRFEVIDYDTGEGRVLVKYGVKVELSYQDDNRTLKVFVSTRTDDRECS